MFAPGLAVETIVLPVEEYYEHSCELIDSAAFRKRKKIRAVRGAIYDLRGRLDQRFENHYSVDGILEESMAIHADGQTIEIIGTAEEETVAPRTREAERDRARRGPRRASR